MEPKETPPWQVTLLDRPSQQVYFQDNSPRQVRQVEW